MASENQAKIFRRLYVQTANQDHIQEWAMGLEHKDASPIIAKLIPLTRDLSIKDPDTFIKIQDWGREQCKALGYAEKPISPSL